MRAASAAWKPGQVADPVQRVRNLLYVAAVPDVFQMQIWSASCRSSSSSRFRRTSRRRTSSKSSIGLRSIRSMATTRRSTELRPLASSTVQLTWNRHGGGRASMPSSRDRLRPVWSSQPLHGYFTNQSHGNHREEHRSKPTGVANKTSTLRDLSSSQRHRALPRARLARRGWRSRASGSARGRSVAELVVRVGAQDDKNRSPRCGAQSSAASNSIDTAAVYRLGHSEELVGRVPRDYPRQPALHLHQCGLVSSRRIVWPRPTASVNPPRCGAKSTSRSRGSASANRPLQDALAGGRRHADRIVLADASRPEGRRQGPSVALSNREVNQLEATNGSGASIRCSRPSPRPHEALSTTPSCTRARRRGDRLSPMHRPVDRILRGARPKRSAPTTGARGHRFQCPRLQKNLALADTLRPIAARHGAPSARSPRLDARRAGVPGAIVGARSPEQVDGSIDAGTYRSLRRRPRRITRHRGHAARRTVTVDSRSLHRRRSPQSESSVGSPSASYSTIGVDDRSRQSRPGPNCRRRLPTSTATPTADADCRRRLSTPIVDSNCRLTTRTRTETDVED